MSGARQTTDRTQRVSITVECFLLRAGAEQTEEFVQALFDKHARRLGAVVGLDVGTIHDTEETIFQAETRAQAPRCAECGMASDEHESEQTAPAACGRFTVRS